MQSFRHRTLTYYVGSIFYVLLAAPTSIAAPFAYVTNFNGNSVSAVDLATGAVVGAPINSPGNPFGIAVSPDAKRAYVTSMTLNSLSVIDTTTNTVSGAPIAVGGAAKDVAVTPDGARAYVTLAGATTVAVVDTTTRTLLPTVNLNGVIPNAIAIAPDGKRAFVAGLSVAQVIDTTSNLVTATLNPMPGASANMNAVAVSPDSKRVYLASTILGDFGSTNSSTLSVVDATTNALIANIPLIGPANSRTDSVAISPDGKSAYVTDGKTGLVWVVDTATNTLTTTIATSALTTPSGAEDIAFSSDGKRAFTVQPDANAVAVIDTATKTLAPPIAVGALPKGIAIAPVVAPATTAFASFTASLNANSRLNAFTLNGRFTLGAGNNGVRPLAEAVKLSVGPYSVTIPAGSFRAIGRSAVFLGLINGARLSVTISPYKASTYTIYVDARYVALLGLTNPAPVILNIGDDGGAVSVRPRF